MQTLLYQCPHCHSEVEVEEALIGEIVSCPNEACGRPFRLHVPDVDPQDPSVAKRKEPGEERLHLTAGKSGDEKTIHTAHPAMFRKHPIRFLAISLTIAIGLIGMLVSAIGNAGLQWNNEQVFATSTTFWISFVLLLAGGGYMLFWWLQIINTTLTVTSKRTRLRYGIISKSSSEVQHDDVRNLQIHQNVFERIMGVGDLAVSSSGQDDLEIYVEAIPHANKVASMIRDMQ